VKIPQYYIRLDRKRNRLRLYQQGEIFLGDYPNTRKGLDEILRITGGQGLQVRSSNNISKDKP
jgi:hypothetical protein